MTSESPIPLVDLAPLHARLRAPIERAIARVIEHGGFVGGPEVGAFEAAFARYCGADQAVGVGSGTDALIFALAGLGIGSGDEVVTVSHTFAGTLDGILHVGARPVMIDVDEHSQCIDPGALAELLARRERERGTGSIRAVLAVHLFGRPAPIDEIRAAIGDRAIAIVEDAAQAHGARLGPRRAGSLGRIAAFSFYPTKNLGAIGDAGAVVTSDLELAARVRALANHGRAPGEKYRHLLAGRNSRLDAIQAAVLSLKLAGLDAANDERRRYAAAYRQRLSGIPGLTVPAEPPHVEPAHHLFVVRTTRRDALAAHLAARGIGTGVHYPVPCHLQPAYRELGSGEGSLPITERLARENLSLPLYVGLGEDRIDRVSAAVRSFFDTSGHPP